MYLPMPPSARAIFQKLKICLLEICPVTTNSVEVDNFSTVLVDNAALYQITFIQWKYR